MLVFSISSAGVFVEDDLAISLVCAAWQMDTWSMSMATRFVRESSNRMHHFVPRQNCFEFRSCFCYNATNSVNVLDALAAGRQFSEVHVKTMRVL